VLTSGLVALGDSARSGPPRVDAGAVPGMIWIGAGLAVIAAIVAVLYNRLVRDRTPVDGAWSNIDVQLQRRHDLIPQLVKAVDQYAKYQSPCDRRPSEHKKNTPRAQARGSVRIRGSGGRIWHVAGGVRVSCLTARVHFIL
jgi:hypothetical protein